MTPSVFLSQVPVAEFLARDLFGGDDDSGMVYLAPRGPQLHERAAGQRGPQLGPVVSRTPPAADSSR